MVQGLPYPVQWYSSYFDLHIYAKGHRRYLDEIMEKIVFHNYGLSLRIEKN